MTLVVEVAHRSLNKAGEEICGDWVKIARSPQSTVIALSDGLGSGVKANILATLTTEIATSMIQQGASFEETLETITATLPSCKVRRTAYATITLLKIDVDGTAYVAEYDNPRLFYVRGGRAHRIERVERQLGTRRVLEANLSLSDGDYLVAVSDGVTHAGIGGRLSLGWGEQAIERFVAESSAGYPDSYELVDRVAERALEYYDGRPGDDATIVVARTRPTRYLTVLTGPPASRGDDAVVVRKLIAAPGRKIVCGGTTANVACRVLGRDAEPVMDAGGDDSVPPTAMLPGVGLVTEGVVTMNRAIEHIRVSASTRDLPRHTDGATELARALLDADHIHLLVGGAINPMQIADVIRGRAFRHILIDTLVRELTQRGKFVVVENC